MDGPLTLLVLLRLVVAAALSTSAGPAAPLAQTSEEIEVVEVYLHDAGGDAIDLYSSHTAYDVYGLMNDVAHAFGAVPDEPAITDYRGTYDDHRTAGAQFEGRLARRNGERLELHFDTTALSRVMAAHDLGAYRLRVCPPDVRRRVSISTATEADGYGCHEWIVEPRGRPTRVDITLLPDASEYARLVVTLVALALFASVAAAVAATMLRRRVIRSFGGGAIAAGVIGVAVAVLVPLVAMIVLANAQRPVSSLVVAHDLTAPRQVAATILPSLLLAAPGTVFAVIALLAPIDVSRLRGPAAPAVWRPPQSGPGLPTWLDR